MTMPLSNNAQRQARWRDRRRRKVIIIAVELGPGGVAALVKGGLLPEKERNNPETVRAAYGRLVVAALQGANNGLLRGI